MGLNFPNSPIQGQVFTSTTGLQYVYLDGVWRIVEAPQDIGKAESRNRIVNGAMQISQENGNTGTGPTVTLGFYPADQWNILATLSPGTASTQRVQVVTPNGSKDRIRVQVGTAKAGLGAGDYLIFRQVLEASKTADFRYGSASAKQAILRFGFKAPAGTYSVHLLNGAAGNRSYLALFTISAGQANTDTEQTIVIPGDTTGTWVTDTSAGVILDITLAAGTALQGALGWQAGVFFGTASNTNGMATTGAVYELFDVGLYLDPLNTGIAPPWQMPDEAEELRACQRYYEKGVGLANVGGYGSAGGGLYSPIAFKVTKRITAAAAAIPTWAGASNASGQALTNILPDGCTFNVIVTAAGHAYLLGGTVIINARM